MRSQIIRRGGSLLAATLAGALLAVGQSTPQQVTLTPTYTAGTELDYSMTIHASIDQAATIDTSGAVVMKILPGAQPGDFSATLHFTSYHSAVTAADPAVKAQLIAQTAADDKNAMAMAPAQFHFTANGVEVASRTQGSEYDSAVTILEDLARTDALPLGPVAVGSRWSKVRSIPIPTMNFSMALSLDCSLTAIGNVDGAPAATVTEHAQGHATVPPGSFPGSSQLAAQGLVPEATVSLDATSSSQYRVADGVLESSTSETHNHVQVRFVGPNPQAQTTENAISSTGNFKLDKIIPPAAGN